MNCKQPFNRGFQPEYAVIYGCILFIGLPINIISICLFLRNHSLKSPNVIFMVNLAVSDLLLAGSLPVNVYYYTTGKLPPEIMNRFLKSLFIINMCSSSIFITFISLDRLLAIVFPLRSRHVRTAANAVKAAAVVWLFVLFLHIPKYFFPRNCRAQNNTLPGLENKDKRRSLYIDFQRKFLLTLVLFLLIVNIVSTVLVSRTLRRNVEDLSKINSKCNVMLLFIINLVIFAMCFVPWTCMFLVSDQRPLKCMAAFNCCLDPLLYYFSMDAFWQKKKERNQLKASGDIQIIQNPALLSPAVSGARAK